MVAYAEKQKCRELPLGKAYFSCLKGKVGIGGNSSSDPTAKSTENSVKDDRSWYQKLKDGKPLSPNSLNELEILPGVKQSITKLKKLSLSVFLV